MGELVELIVDKYDGSLKAEHGTGRNMAPYVEREWGAKATEMMWRIKRAGRPGRRAQPGRAAEPRPGRPPARPEVDAARSRTWQRQRVHRVRLLRAGLPEPRPDHHAAPADRAAPRDGAPARGLAGARGAARASTSTTAIETCAADGTCRLACPVGIDTGKLVKELRARAHARAPSAARRAARAGRGRARGRAGLRPAARGARAGRRRRARLGARRAGGARRSWCPRGRRAAARRPGAPARDARARAPRPSTCRPASTGSSARSRADAGAALAARGAGRRSPRAPACRCGSRRTSPGTAAPRRGARRATARATRTWRRTLAEALWRWTDGGALPVVIDATSCAHGIAEEVPGARRRCARAARRVRVSTRSPGRTTACCRALDGPAPRGVGRRAPDLLGAPPRPGRDAGGARARARPTRSSCPLGATCCGMAGDRGLLHPELTAAGHARRGGGGAARRVRRPPVAQPHLRDRAGARHRPALRVVRAAARGRHAAVAGAARGELRRYISRANNPAVMNMNAL